MSAGGERYHLSSLLHIGALMNVADRPVDRAVILVVEVVVIGGHVILAGRVRTLLRTPTIVRRVSRTDGGVIVGSGVAVVASR